MACVAPELLCDFEKMDFPTFLRLLHNRQQKWRENTPHADRTDLFFFPDLPNNP
jgi:hypothetical protein